MKTKYMQFFFAVCLLPVYVHLHIERNAGGTGLPESFA